MSRKSYMRFEVCLLCVWIACREPLCHQFTTHSFMWCEIWLLSMTASPSYYTVEPKIRSLSHQLHEKTFCLHPKERRILRWLERYSAFKMCEMIMKRINMLTRMKRLHFWGINAVGVNGTKGDCQNIAKLPVISASDVVKSIHNFDLWKTFAKLIDANLLSLILRWDTLNIWYYLYIN